MRETGALVVRFCNTFPKSCRFWHGQTEALESHPKGRLVTEQFVNRRDELLIQGNILRTFPNNCKCGRGLYVRQELLVLWITRSPSCHLSLQTKKSSLCVTEVPERGGWWSNSLSFCSCIAATCIPCGSSLAAPAGRSAQMACVCSSRLLNGRFTTLCTTSASEPSPALPLVLCWSTPVTEKVMRESSALHTAKMCEYMHSECSQCPGI